MDKEPRGDGWLKLIVLVIGAPFTFLALMTLASTFTANVWIQLGLAAVVAIALPLWVADRIVVFRGGLENGRGVTSSVLAGTWTLIPVLVLCLGLGWVSPLLRAEAAILDESALAPAAKVARMIALEQRDVAEQEPPLDGNQADQTQEPTVHVPEQVQEQVQVQQPVQVQAQEDVAETAAVVSNHEGPMTPSTIFRRWADSVVSVQSFQGQTDVGGGTGFVVGRDLVVTNHHVVARAIFAHEHGGGVRVGVQAKDGSWAQNVTLIDYDADRDLALIRCELPGNVPAVTLADDAAIVVGEPAISIGNPYGLDHTLTDGIVSARRMYEGSRWIQVSSPISPGNSGGPIFDEHGVVIGVTTRVATTEFRAQNLNLAIPASDVQTFIDRTPTLDAPIQLGGGGTQQVGTW